MQGYFLVVAAYYGLMTPGHMLTLAGFELVTMVTASTTACLVAMAAWYRLRSPMKMGAMEGLISLVNLLILANVMAALTIDYHAAKLVYFVMMAMIFAFASISLRQGLASITVALACLFWVVSARTPADTVTWGFVAFAAALSSVAIAYYLRRVIGLAVMARTEAEGRLASAEKRSREMHLESLSDSLTGLPNRRAFFRELQLRKDMVASGIGHWLVLLDLDGFKAVNDNYGHLIGDALLQAVAKRLRDHCGQEAFASRMGGDEFNIILASDEDAAGIEQWSQSLLEAVAETYLIEDRLIQISASLGCHRLEARASDNRMIRNADYALLRAKRDGKNRVVVFRQEHAEDAALRFKVEQSLRVASFADEIELLFQPQFDLGQGRIVSAEALARWHSPSIGQVGPDRFIKIAEDCGLISRITVAVLAKSLTFIESWDDPVPLSVNLSGHDLMSDQVIEQVLEIVARSKVPPELLEFEITETAMMPDTARASQNLHRLAARGHPLSLDDFGTGYSNFSYLRSLPISKLKVDRAFMQDLGDPMTEKVLNSLTGMARTLDVHCLLEGIETELELLAAKRVGAQSVQGFYFGRPMDGDALKQLLANDRKADQVVKLAEPKRAAG
ncbi:MAG: EAL domain-containing protein [Sphingomonadaceae bacterium]|nr:EAL domain-containing protein [Sphingomonadaceae bacterium]